MKRNQVVTSWSLPSLRVVISWSLSNVNIVHVRNAILAFLLGFCSEITAPVLCMSDCHLLVSPSSFCITIWWLWELQNLSLSLALPKCADQLLLGLCAGGWDPSSRESYCCAQRLFNDGISCVYFQYFALRRMCPLLTSICIALHSVAQTLCKLGSTFSIWVPAQDWNNRVSCRDRLGLSLLQL